MKAGLPHTALVLAAGLGTRMRPLTETCPKPLIRVGGQPLIARVLAPLREAGVSRLVVNVHYLADQMEAWLGGLEGFEISDERSLLLETGGGFAKARPLLGPDPVFVVNTDAFFVPAGAEPLREMAEAFNPATDDECLLLADTGRCLGFDGAGDFFLGPQGRLRRRGEAPAAPFAFTGVRIVNPAVYADVPAGPFPANRIWDRLLAEGRLSGHVLNAFWLHVGDPQAVRDAEMWTLFHGA